MHFFFFKLYTAIVKEETTRTAAGWHLGWKESSRNRARYKDPVGIFARRWQLKRVAIACNSRSGVWRGGGSEMDERVGGECNGWKSGEYMGWKTGGENGFCRSVLVLPRGRSRGANKGRRNKPRDKCDKRAGK